MEYIYEAEYNNRLFKWLQKSNLNYEVRDKKIYIKFDDYYMVYKFEKFLKALKAGFDTDYCEKILYGDWDIYEIDLKKVSEKKENHMVRIKGRIIGEKRKSIKEIMEITGAKIIVSNRYVYIVGDSISLQSAYETIRKLIRGSTHSRAFNYAAFYKKNLENKEKEIKEKSK